MGLSAGVGLFAIHGSSPTDVWTVGQGGVALHRGLSGDWVRADIPTAEDLRDVFVLSPADVWAVGGAGGSAHVFHWDGTRWSRVGGVPRTLYLPAAVTGTGPRDVTRAPSATTARRHTSTALPGMKKTWEKTGPYGR